MKPLDERRIMVKKEMNLSQVWATDITYIPMRKRFYVFDCDHRFAHEIISCFKNETVFFHP
jgi:hypothetical protein